MKRIAGFLVVAGLLTASYVGATELPKPDKCAEDLEVLKLVYATSRSNAEAYLETLARTDIKLKVVQAELDAANAKVKTHDEVKPKE